MHLAQSLTHIGAGCNKIMFYEFSKKGVDVSDQMASYNTALRKTNKWYMKIAMELITGTALLNS